MRLPKFKSAAGYTLFLVIVMGMASAEIYDYIADRPLAYVRRYRPSVSIFPKNISAERGEPLFNGDTLRTNDKGYAAVQFMDKSIAKVKPNSELIVKGTVQNNQSISTRIGLEVGEIFIEVTRQNQSNFEVATSKSVASVKGTRFGVTSDNYVWVEEGIVDLTAIATGEIVTLREKMFGAVNNDDSITSGELSDEQLEQLQKEFDELTDSSVPGQIKLRFRDENGQIREIDIDYYDNN